MIVSCVYYIKHFLAKVLNFPSYVPKHTFLEANMAMNRLCSLKVWGTGGGVHRAYTYLEKECEGRRSCLLLRCTLESSGPMAEGTCLLASSSKHFAISNAFVGSKVCCMKFCCCGSFLACVTGGTVIFQGRKNPSLFLI